MSVKKGFFVLFIVISIVATGLLVALNNASQNIKYNVSQKPETPLQKAAVSIKTLAQSEPEKEFLLPDQIVTVPESIYITNDGQEKLIRFSTTFINIGKGPLEFYGHEDEVNEVVHATQYLKELGGPGEFRSIGSFVFHPDHKHWHVEDYVYYQLFPIGMEEAEPIAQTDKMSFCIWDEYQHDLELEGAPDTRQYFFECHKRMQGMSVGWSDTYAADFAGQLIDITGVPDGRYIFKSIVNPDRKVTESNYDNNTSEILIEIIGNSLTTIE